MDGKVKIIPKITSNDSGREQREYIIVVKRHCEWYSYVVLIKEVFQNWRVCDHIKDQRIKGMDGV